MIGLFIIINTAWAAPTTGQIELPQIEQAYKREILFLTAQKRELEKRRNEYRELISEQEKANQKKIAKLESVVTQLKVETDGLKRELLQLERDVEGRETDSKNLETLIQRARIGLNMSEEGEQKALSQLKQLFEEARTELLSATQVTKGPADFFNPDGVLVSGQRVQVGRVADFGLTPDGRVYTLAPAGNKEFKAMRSIDWKSTEEVLRNGQGVLPVFLHESSDQEYAPKKEKTFVEVMEAAGPIGWVIVALGLVTLLMTFLRALMLYRANQAGQVEPEQWLKTMDFEDTTNAFGRLLKRLSEKKDLSNEEIEGVASEQLLKEWTLIDRFGTIILVAASVAPLLGLLGTVTGMIATFDIITEYGTGDPKLLSSGISEALVTTMLGLIVAIPALIIGSLLSAQSEKIKSKMEELVLVFLNNRGEKAS